MKAKPHEVAVNYLLGKTYYKTVFRPKISKESKKWNGWNGKNACLILSYDIDEESDIALLPKLLELLNKYGIKASFAVIGLLAKKNPELFNELLKNGHELINHTQTHPDSIEFNPDKHFHTIPSNERFIEIKQCHDTVKELFKYEMKGFRVPHFGYQFTPDIYESLEKLGYRFSSSTLAINTKTQGFPFRQDNVWELPMICCPKHPFCIFDTSHAFRSRFARHEPEDYIRTFEHLISDGIKHNMFINLYQDPQDIDKFDYETMLEIIIKNKDKLWITTYGPLCDYLDNNKLYKKTS